MTTPTTPTEHDAGPRGISRDDARALIESVLRDIVPDASLAGLPDGTDLRDTFELDSLDFVELVERLGKRGGFRIADEDAERLRRLDSALDFVAPRALPVR